MGVPRAGKVYRHPDDNVNARHAQKTRFSATDVDASRMIG